MIVERQGVLTAEQCRRLVNNYGRHLTQSTVAGSSGRAVSPSRTSWSSKLDALPHDVDAELRAFVLEVTGASPDRLEPWEITRYRLGERFERHTDGMRRSHSVVVYLNDCLAGGETVFPVLRRVIRPEMGKAVAWNNCLDGRVTAESTHESRPVLDGEKWVLVGWVS